MRCSDYVKYRTFGSVDCSVLTLVYDFEENLVS
jgi:hypothetical protein